MPVPGPINRHLVKLHQSPEAGRDDGAGARQSHLGGNVGVITHGEITIVEGKFIFPAIIIKTLDSGFQQAQPSIIAVLSHIIGQCDNAVKARMIARIRQDFQLGRLIERDLRLEIANDKGNCFAEVPIGWISDDSGSWIRLCVNNHVSDFAGSYRALGG